jgi:predicted metal-dependent enzyme (double-stranded beta helix superfamily)
MSFNLSEFIGDCKVATQEPSPQKTIANMLTAALANPTDVINALEKPTQAKVDKLFVSEKLTVLNVVWAPRMSLYPHNHNTWSVIGVYCGRENNILWRRVKDDRSGRIEAAGALSLGVAEVKCLGKDLIHSVNNPVAKFTGAIHVYGGDFFNLKRSEWDPETLLEQPYDVEKNMKYFESANQFQP